MLHCIMPESDLLNLADSVISVDTDEMSNLAPGQVPASFAPFAADTGTIIPPEMVNIYATIVAQINYAYRI